MIAWTLMTIIKMNTYNNNEMIDNNCMKGNIIVNFVYIT